MFIVRETMIEDYAQHLDICSLLQTLPEKLANFELRIVRASEEGAGHYGLGYIDGGEVHMIISEYRRGLHWSSIILISLVIGFIIWRAFIR